MNPMHAFLILAIILALGAVAMLDAGSIFNVAG